MDSTFVTTFTRLNQTEKCIRRACDQMILLNDKLGNMKIRYERAVKVNIRCFRYPLRMKIVIIEGVINTYYEYIMLRQKEVEELRCSFLGEEPTYSTDDEDLTEQSE